MTKMSPCPLTGMIMTWRVLLLVARARATSRVIQSPKPVSQWPVAARRKAREVVDLVAGHHDRETASARETLNPLLTARHSSLIGHAYGFVSSGGHVVPPAPTSPALLFLLTNTSSGSTLQSYHNDATKTDATNTTTANLHLMFLPLLIIFKYNVPHPRYRGIK
ncbi:hypothetical protein GWK47_053007 [Chionoecetes opilio]|uniref:Secreted protein n=1 Tax=Chionoecetes opilio TaxID=41210 RepID=A0A8J4XZI3_CHIOP|nr:hypothetical protein GWK47_053007 [Chionoecetes opilio]